MKTRNSEGVRDAHRRMRRSLRERMVLREDLTSDDRAKLITRHKAELDKLHQNKERAIQVFDDEILHREKLISRLDEGNRKEQQAQQSPSQERPPDEDSPGKIPGT